MRDTALFGGGAVDSCGSMSTLLMSSEDSSSPYPEEDESSELELGLGLSLGRGGGIGNAKFNPADGGAGSWDQYARILTAKEFQSRISTKAPSSSSSSSSSSPVIKTNINCIGSKRTAEPSSLSAVSSQVRGWPPIATHRINSLVNHKKSPVNEESALNVDKHIITTIGMDKINYSSYRNNNVSKERGPLKTSLFVKVNMDGISIGRKVDLHAHSCYETLAQTLDHMFTPDAVAGARRSNVEEQALMGGRGQPMRLLDDSSDFVLTYEDKEGDWMLVGDVPWEMFLSSVRRLRIRRTAEANGLAPRSRGRN